MTEDDLEQLIFEQTRCLVPAIVLTAVLKMLADRDNRISGLEAARIAYASEFPPDAEGLPDVGNVHANIRAMKKDAERMEWLLQHINTHRLYQSKKFWYCVPLSAQDWQDGFTTPREAIDAAMVREAANV